MGTDTLSDVLRTVRLSGATFFDVVARAPWAAEQPPQETILPRISNGASHLIAHHVILEGHCFANIADEDPIGVEAGEVIVFTKGDPHVMASDPGMRAAPICFSADSVLTIRKNLQTLPDSKLSETAPPIRRNLVMVSRRREPHALRDFCEVAAYCRQMAPDIRPIPLFDAFSSQLRYSIFVRPTLIFALRRLLFYHPLRGVVRSSKLLPKSEEYRRMEAIGIPVPRWRLLTRRHSPGVADLGRYVVSKPDYGGLGADVRIRRAGRVRWAPANTPGASPAAPASSPRSSSTPPVADLLSSEHAFRTCSTRSAPKARTSAGRYSDRRASQLHR